jgi:hypothetical protein
MWCRAQNTVERRETCRSRQPLTGGPISHAEGCLPFDHYFERGKAMTVKEYRKLGAVGLAGKAVITMRPMSNGVTKIPTGTILTIDHIGPWIALITKPCKKCGVCIYITHVYPEDVELLEPQPKEGKG